MKLLGLIFILTVSLFANNVDELMEKSGVILQIKQLKESSITYANLITRDENSLNKFKESFYKNFDTSILLNKTKLYVENSLSTKDIEILLEWFNSPIGNNIVNEEVSASSVEAVNEMVIMIPELAKDKIRVQKAIDIENKLNYTNEYVILTKLLFDKLIPNDKNSVKRKNFFDNYAKQTYNQIIGINLYTYRNVSYENLDLYIEFLSKSVAKKYSDVLFKIQKDIILNWIVNSFKDSGLI